MMDGREEVDALHLKKRRFKKKLLNEAKDVTLQQVVFKEDSSRCSAH